MRPQASSAAAAAAAYASVASTAGISATELTGPQLFQRGCALAAAQDWRAASEDLKEVLRREQDHEEARRELERVLDCLREEQGLPARARQAEESREAVASAEADKAEGTRLFQEGRYYEAYKAWSRGIDLVEDLALDGQGEEVRKLAVALCSNAAQALLKCPEVEGATTKMAVSMADKALELDPTNVKALFRRGLAYANAGWWPLARSDFQEVLQLEPRNEAARRELRKVEELAPKPTPAVSSRSTGGSRRAAAEAAAADAAPAAEQSEAPAAAPAPPAPAAPADPAELVRKAQKEAERFRKEILAMADRTGKVGEWCQRFNRAQTMTAQWVKHQLEDPEVVKDLEMLRGPLFEAMNPQQREDFLCAYEFVQDIRENFGQDIDQMAQLPL